jgi:Mg/Co/Ni transporter MgtE
LQQIKEQINYSSLVKEVEALSNLKQMLGHFSSANDRNRFTCIINHMLDVIPVAILEQTQKDGATQCAALFTDETVALCLLQDLSDQWENVEDAKKYVRAAVGNLRWG